MGGGLEHAAEYITGDWELGVPLVLTHVSFDPTYDSLKKWGLAC